MDNVVLLPHVGSASHATRRAMDQLVANNIISWFSGKEPLTPVAETPVRSDARMMLWSARPHGVCAMIHRLLACVLLAVAGTARSPRPSPRRCRTMPPAR